MLEPLATVTATTAFLILFVTVTMVLLLVLLLVPLPLLLNKSKEFKRIHVVKRAFLGISELNLGIAIDIELKLSGTAKENIKLNQKILYESRL